MSFLIKELLCEDTCLTVQRPNDGLLEYGELR